MWKVRAEIVGEFVNSEVFETEAEAREYEQKLWLDGVYDSIDVYEI